MHVSAAEETIQRKETVLKCLLMSMHVRKSNRLQCERRATHIVRGDYVNSLLNEKKKPVLNRAQT